MPLFRRGSGGGAGVSGTVSGTPGKVAIFSAPTVAGNSAFIAEDANGVNVTGGNLNATQGSVVSMARGGAGHIGAICLNNTSGSRADTVLTGQALLTGDFSAYTKVKLPYVNPGANQYIWSIFDPSSADCINVIINTGVRIDFVAKKTGETTLTLAGTTTLFTQLLGQVIGIGVKRVGNVCTFYINGVSIGTLTGNACTVSYSAAAKSQAGNLASSATPFLGNIYCNRIYNRALSDADFAAIGSGGVDATDEYGSQTPVLTTDFSAGVNNFTSIRSTVTGNVDGIGSPSTSDVLSILCDGTASNSHGAQRTGLMVVGKRYRIYGQYFIPSSQAIVNSITFGDNGTLVAYYTGSVTGTWATFSAEFVCNNNTGLAIYLRNTSSGSVFSGNSTDIAYVKGIIITPIGCISAPAFNIGNGSTLPDRSPNGLSAALVGGWTHTIPIKDVYTDNLKVTNDVVGNFGANDGNLPSAVRAGAGAVGGIYFNGVNGSHSTMSVAGQTPGTGPFSIHIRFRMPSSAWPVTFAGIALLGPSTSAATNGFSIYGYQASDTVFLEFDGSSSSNNRRWILPTGIRTTYAGQVVDLIFVRDSTPQIVAYLNGVEQTLTQTTAGTDPTAAADITPATPTFTCPFPTTPFNGTIFNARYFNFALTALEASELTRRGVSPSDEYGSQTAVYSSDHSAGTDSWTSSLTTLAGNIDGIGSPSTDDTLRVTIDGTSGTHYAARNGFTTIGKRYRLSIDCYIPSGQSVVSGLVVTDGSITIASTSVTGSWVTLTSEFVSTGNILFKAATGAATTITGNGSDVLYLKKYILTEIGVIFDFDFAVGSGATIPGRSTNNLEAALAGTYQHTVPKRVVSAVDVFKLGSLGDWVLKWVSAGVAAIRNGAVGQALRLNGTYTDDSNQRYLEIVNTTAGDASINSRGIGTGATGNKLSLGAGGVVGVRLNEAGGIEGPLGTLSRTHAGDVSAILPSATVGSRVDATLSRHTIGTGDFTYTCRAEIPSTNPSTIPCLITFGEDVNNRIYLQVSTGGVLQLVTRFAGTTVTSTVLSSLMSLYGGSVVFIAAVRTGTSVAVSINGVVVATVTDATCAVSYTSAAKLYLGNVDNANQPWTQRIYNARLFRFAMSASDVVNLMNKGVDPSWEWDNPTAVYTSDFSAGLDGWAVNARATIAGNIDAIGSPSTDDTLRATVDSTASSSHSIAKSAGIFTIGKRYRVTFSAFIPVSQSADGLYFSNASGVIIPVTSGSAAMTTVGTWQTGSFEFVATATALSAYFTSAGSATFSGNGTDVFYLKSIVVSQIGCVLDWDFGLGVGLTVPDRSDNCYVGTGTGITHPRPARYGSYTICQKLNHSGISATAATTKLLDIPKNCGVTAVEVDRTTPLDSGVTLNFGVSGTPAKHVSAMVASSAGLVYAASLSPGSESSLTDTALYIQKSGPTTVGDIIVKVTISIRG